MSTGTLGQTAPTSHRTQDSVNSSVLSGLLNNELRKDLTRHPNSDITGFKKGSRKHEDDQGQGFQAGFSCGYSV